MATISSVLTSGVKERVQEFWQQSPCDSWFTDHQPGTSEFYRSLDEHRYKVHQRLLSALEVEKTRGLRVLEVGCGCGSDAERFARTGARYTGIDLTDMAIRLSRKRFQLAGLKGRFLQGDAEDLPFPDDSFDVRELRRLGWNVRTISIRKPLPKSSSESAIEREEFDSTWYVLTGRLMDLLVPNLLTFAHRPLRYLRGLIAALRFGGLSPRRSALAIAYFLEAVCVGHRLQKIGLQYVHTHFSTSVAFILAHIFDIHLSMTIHGPVEFDDPVGLHWRKDIGCRVRVHHQLLREKSVMLWSSPMDWHKLTVTPLGVHVSDPPVVRSPEDRQSFEMIAVGRLVDVKGFPLLLEAVAALSADERKVRLTLVGEGPGLSDLKDQAKRLGISNIVVFAGLQDQASLKQLYADSDLCVLTSFAEGVPVVLMEAMAIGIPCVAPRIYGIPELIRHGIDGLLFAPFNVSELVSAIGEVMDNPALWSKMSRSCWEQVGEKYELGKNVSKLSTVFSKWMSVERGDSELLCAAQTHRLPASCEPRACK